MILRRQPRCALLAACLLLSTHGCEAASLSLDGKADGSAMHVTRTVKGAASGSREVESAGTDGGVTGSGEGQDRRQLRHRQISQVHDPISMNAQEAEPVHVQEGRAAGQFSAQLVDPVQPATTPITKQMPVSAVPDVPVSAVPSTETFPGTGGDITYLHGQSTASQADLDALFGQIYADLQPFSETGITLEMVEQVYCMFNTQSFRLQVIGGQMYIAGETLPFAQIQDRFKIMISNVWSRYRHRLPDLDMMVQFDDWMIPNLAGKHPHGPCALQGPVVTPSKMATEMHGLLAPDSSWMDPPGWEVNRELLLDAAARQPWHNRTSKLMFRGAPTGMRQWMLGPELSWLKNDALDVALRSWWRIEDADDTVSAAEECSYKYLLYMPGNTWANRMKYLFACGSTVIMPRDRFIAFWWHLLQDRMNVYIIDPLTGGNSAGPYLRSVVEELRVHDAEAKAMGDNAFRIIRDTLHPDNIYEYWFRLITEYAKLQRFTPTLHPDAIPLAESMMRVAKRKVVHFDNRTCDICLRPMKEHVWHSHHMAGVGRV